MMLKSSSSFINISPFIPNPLSLTTITSTSYNFSVPRPNYPLIYPHIKSKWGERALMFRLNCSNNDEGQQSQPETSGSLSSISSYTLCAGLGGIGFAETAYLTYLKLTNSEAFCPVGGGTCGDVLNSDYASVFGVPLPLIGMFAYGLVTVYALQLAGKKLPFVIDDTDSRSFLLGITTSMATASTYFLYILSTKFEGASCVYCLASALLSFSLFFTIVKEFGLQEIQKRVGLQLCLGGLVIAILSTSYSSSQSVAISSADIELPFFTTEITTKSSSLSLALANHLHSIGAKMYGAFWCSHCLEQKEMFGQEAAKLIDYVECFPSGYRKGIKIEKACADAGIEGFPTWIINGEVLSGDQELSELARVSGFKLDDLVSPN